MISDNVEFLSPFLCRVLAAILKMVDILKIYYFYFYYYYSYSFFPRSMNLSTADLRNYRTEFHDTWWSYRYMFLVDPKANRPLTTGLKNKSKATFEIEQCWIFAVLWRPFWKWRPVEIFRCRESIPDIIITVREFRIHMKNPAQTGSGCIRFSDWKIENATFAEYSCPINCSNADYKNMFNSKLLTFDF
jgi:hypothetical protein